MGDLKSIFASRTFWGALMAVAAGAAGIFGYTIAVDDQQALIEGGAGVAAVVGGFIAIWGRIRASKLIR